MMTVVAVDFAGSNRDHCLYFSVTEIAIAVGVEFHYGQLLLNVALGVGAILKQKRVAIAQ